jgi:serine/threonine protein phosphatase PrpC
VGWKAVSRSVIGSSHQQQKLPCQDCGGSRVLDQLVVGAIADGAGSATHAEVGAKLAVTAMLEYLSATEIWLQKQQNSWQTLPHKPTEDLVRKLFEKAVSQVIEVLHRQAESSHYEFSDLACTLLAFLATPDWVAAMQIGDGFMIVRSPDSDYQLVFQPDKGEFANQTTFITSSSALDEMQIRVLPLSPIFICASSDALERVAIRMADWTPFTPFFIPLEEYLQETSNPDVDDTYRMSFLESDRLNQRTDDDKTLLLCRYEPEQG